MNWKGIVSKPWSSHAMKIAIAIAIVVLYVPVRVVTLDPYGQCHKFGNLKLCFDSWLNLEGIGLPFKMLMTDGEMIDRLQKHLNDFEVIVIEAQQPNGGGDDVLFPKGAPIFSRMESVGIEWIKRSRDYVKREITCLQPYSQNLADCQQQVWKWQYIALRADATRVIDASFEPYGNLVKYYVYYPWEEPILKQEGLHHDSSHKSKLVLDGDSNYIVNSLDSDWPDGWLERDEYPPCLMRRINAHWYLKLCKNDIGA